MNRARTPSPVSVTHFRQSQLRAVQVSRRVALRYSTAVSALAGLGAAAAGKHAAAAAAPTLIDYAMRQIPAQDIRVAGVINYVSAVDARRAESGWPLECPWPLRKVGRTA